MSKLSHFFIGCAYALALTATVARRATGQGSGHLIQVVVGYACGMCSGSFPVSDITVDSTTLRERLIAPGEDDTLRHKPRTRRGQISIADWNAVRDLATKADSEFVGRIGCPGCTDAPIRWVEVHFSDGTRKSVEFDSNGPPTIKKLIDLVDTLRIRR